jgi:hypothetical protein
MRDRKERRKAVDTPLSPLEDNGRTSSFMERRKHHDRRLENLDVEERQLMFSEMPSPTPKKPS